MKKEYLIGKIEKNVAGMSVYQQRIVYAYAHTLVSGRRRRMGIDDIPKDRPAPGQIVNVLRGITEKAEPRDLTCILKFVGDVQRHF